MRIMRPNMLDEPPPQAWALLDVVIKLLIQDMKMAWRTRRPSEEVDDHWHVLAASYAQGTLRDPLLEMRYPYAISADVVQELRAPTGRFDDERDPPRICIFVPSCVHQHLRSIPDDVRTWTLFDTVEETFVHEFQHLRQWLIGEMPNLPESAVPRYMARPWERDAFAAGVAAKMIAHLRLSGKKPMPRQKVLAWAKESVSGRGATDEDKEDIAMRVVDLFVGTGWMEE